eukprot:TRINITY_DN7823_c0_g1_i1.p2 TRINITY_DN7823_c0_g1~~TRINITY_DN7823_c0_g1_i1.p2  ORF type:complete len:211 (+),score=132.10 TRINITY_DN7823_c0_g1_i1:69-701(+)
MKHNNQIANTHLHKDWERFVKTWFNQPAKKNARREYRAKKAARVFPRPAKGLLRPIVHCATIKYNRRKRIGRGFTLEELKTAGINRKEALGVGISVDFRRTNASKQSLNDNVQRLKAYKAKLVVFPRRRHHPKKGEATKEERKAIVQVKGTVIPPKKPSFKTKFAKITEKHTKAKGAFYTLRTARVEKKMAGGRKRRAEKKAAAAAAAKK